jgi:hypothetical protein
MFRSALLVHLLHLFSQAQRSHIGPDFFDIGQTLRFRPRLARISPAQRILSIRRPDGVLLLVVHHHLIYSRVLAFVVLSHVLYEGGRTGSQRKTMARLEGAARLPEDQDREAERCGDADTGGKQVASLILPAPLVDVAKARQAVAANPCLSHAAPLLDLREQGNR